MCGIIGICAFKKVDEAALARGMKALDHRGPNGEGKFIHRNSAIGHKRLSIIDLSGGGQPLSSADEKIQLVANGEIYNYKDLQKSLAAQNINLKTSSDCEPAIYLYKQHGMSFTSHLRGMYAIAIYNAETEETIIARDPFGIKPLYYANTPHGVVYASEPHAIAATGYVQPQVATHSLGAFFNRQYVGGRYTLWQGIERVLPGEVIKLKGGRIIDRKRHIPALKTASSLSVNEALEGLEHKMNESIMLHLQADVPYGAFLSGGIDSSAMVTKMQQEVKEPVRTFTIGFESNTVSDERTDAERLASALKTNHTNVNFSEADFWQLLPQMAKYMDDPVADYAALPILKLAERAAQDVTVILSGEGGDEIFAGYGRYRDRFLDKIFGKKFRRQGAAKEFANIFGEEIASWHEDGKINPAPEWSTLQARQATDISDWLPDDLLTKVDRCLMAHAIEGRVPYLDDELAAFAFALPDDLKIKGKHGKWLLKKWLSDNQKSVDVWRKKRGFTVPITHWLENKRPQLSAYLCSNEGLREFANPKAIQEILNQPLTPKIAKITWHMLTFAIWHEQHIQQKQALTSF